MKKRILKWLQDIFWNWKFQGQIIHSTIKSTRTDMIYDIMSRITLDETIEWLMANKDKGNKYWTLAQFIDEKLPRKD